MTLPSYQKLKDYTYKASKNEEKDIKIPYDITRDKLTYMVWDIMLMIVLVSRYKTSIRATWTDIDFKESASTTSKDASRVNLDPTGLWHRRLGHINYRDLCMKRKQSKRSHKKFKEIKTTKPLDLLHMDLMGLMQTESRNGKKYVLVVVNDFSRYSFMSFLRKKSKAIEHLKSLFNSMQVEIGHPIVRIRNNRERV
ncbi:hypothetical protein AAG906_027324 [Vitis piasezkii]